MIGVIGVMIGVRLARLIGVMIGVRLARLQVEIDLSVDHFR